MKVSEVIQRYNEDYSSELTNETKIRYIKSLERAIVNEIVMTHEYPEELQETIDNYIPEEGQLPNFWDEHFRTFGMDSELLADDPYDEVYLHYINTRVAAVTANTNEYNRASSFYTTTYIAFQDYWNRNFRPLSKPVRLIHHRLI